MSGLFKYELRKLSKSKLFYICLGVLFALSLLSIAIDLLMSIAMEDIELSASASDYFSETAISFLVERTNISVIASAINSSSLTMVAAIFIVLFVSEDYRNGAIKNVYGRGNSRANVFIAKYLVSLLAVLLMAFFVIIISTVMGVATFKHVSMPSNFIYNIFVQLLTVCAYHAIFFMLTIVLTKIGLAIVAAILGPSLITLVVAFTDAAISSSSPSTDIELSKYVFTNFCSRLSIVSIPTSEISIMLVIVILITALFAGLSYYFLEKRDV